MISLRYTLENVIEDTNNPGSFVLVGRDNFSRSDVSVIFQMDNQRFLLSDPGATEDRYIRFKQSGQRETWGGYTYVTPPGAGSAEPKLLNPIQARRFVINI